MLGGGAPIAQSTVTLWAASAGEPKQLAETKTDNEGRFELRSSGASVDSSLYLVATGGEPKARGGGDNSAIALLAVVGSRPSASVVIDEMTTIASVVTHMQFIDGTVIKGSPLQLRIAAGNVPNFVDLETGGYGATILDALNSAQTPTMANFGYTLQHFGSVRHAVEVRCVQQSVLRGDVSGGRLPKGHAGGR